MKQFILNSLLYFLTISTVLAQSFPLATTAGTAGANVSRVRGGDARFVNPALIGLSGNQNQVIYFPSFAYRLGNNSIRNSHLNEWFQKDREWTLSERETFKNSIKDEFRITGSGGLGLGYQFKQFVFSYDAIGFMDTGIPDEFLDLFATGNQMNTTYNFNGIRGGFWLGSALSSTFAKSFQYITFAEEFSIGLSLKYIIGHYYAGINKADGFLYTNISPDTIIAKGNFLTATSRSGDGISMDMGAAARLNEKLVVSFALLNVGGKVTWDGTNINENSFDVHDSGVPIDSIPKENFLERWANYRSGNVTKKGQVSTALPFFLQLSGDYQLHDEFIVFSSYLQGLNNSNNIIGASPIGKFSLGSEYNKLVRFPLRMGIGLGGLNRFEIGVGGGFRSQSYAMDIAFTMEGGIFSSAKGYGFALSHRYVLN